MKKVLKKQKMASFSILDEKIKNVKFVYECMNVWVYIKGLFVCEENEGKSKEDEKRENRRS